MERIDTDFLVVGAGIMGLAMAKALREYFPGKSICVIEKESGLGKHASGRNSGVLHAGFYYFPDSLKAKFTKQGNQELKSFCENKGIKVNKCGKVVVAKDEKELEILFELKRRGEKNGVELYIVTERELKTLEPNAKTYKYAIYSPNTATVNPIEVLNALEKDLKEKDVRFFYNTPYQRIGDSGIVAGSRLFRASKVINCAGLYADKIAKDFGFSKNYELIPFKGIYLKYVGQERFIQKNIYPVPDIRFPFLGVHFTVQVDGGIKIGPTAMPAFWRENYNGLEGLNLGELVQTIWWNTLMFIKRAEFRRLALEEIKKYIRNYLVKQANKLVHSMPSPRLFKWGESGIRAQLIDKRNLNLVQDFVVEGDEHSVHILNAVSPAFTASFPFSRYIVEEFILKRGSVHGQVQKV